MAGGSLKLLQILTTCVCSVREGKSITFSWLTSSLHLPAYIVCELEWSPLLFCIFICRDPTKDQTLNLVQVYAFDLFPSTHHAPAYYTYNPHYYPIPFLNISPWCSRIFSRKFQNNLTKIEQKVRKLVTFQINSMGKWLGCCISYFLMPGVHIITG